MNAARRWTNKRTIRGRGGERARILVARIIIEWGKANRSINAGPATVKGAKDVLVRVSGEDYCGRHTRKGPCTSGIQRNVACEIYSQQSTKTQGKENDGTRKGDHETGTVALNQPRSRGSNVTTGGYLAGQKKTERGPTSVKQPAGRPRLFQGERGGCPGRGGRGYG